MSEEEQKVSRKDRGGVQDTETQQVALTTRYLELRKEQVSYGRESGIHAYQGLDERVAGLGIEARGQGLAGVREVGVYSHKSGSCVLERSKRRGSPLGVRATLAPTLTPLSL